MRTNRAVKRSSSEWVATRPIVDRQATVKTLPLLAVGKNKKVQDNICYLVLCLHIVYIPSTVLVWSDLHSPGLWRPNRLNIGPDILSRNNKYSQ